MSFTVDRIPRNDEELYWYVRLRFGVAIPRTPVCPDHVPPFVAFADAFFGRNSLDPESPIQDTALWHGSRGLSGKSFMLSLLAIVCAELLGADVNLLGGSLAQSMNIHEHVGSMLDSAMSPEYMIVTQTNSKIEYTNRARIRPLTASQKTVRGPHPPRLLLDEIDEMDLKVLNAALGQPLPQRNYLRQIVQPYAVMCSTWQNAQGTFTVKKREAEQRGIPIYQWCYRESANEVDGWLSQEAIDSKRNSIPTIMWETEYELNEPSIGDRAFDPQAIERTFSLPHLPDPDEPKAGGYIRFKVGKDFEEFVYENPLRGGEYVMAADWAKAKDYTVISVGRVDVRPFRVVYYLRVNRQPYPRMIGYYNKAMQRYRARGIHDATGLGGVVSDYIDSRAYGFMMTGEKRSAMLSEYVSAVESDTWRFPKIPSAYIAHKYASVPDLYNPSREYTDNDEAAGKHHLPDEVCAFGLMHHLVRNRASVVAPPTIMRTVSEQTALQRALDAPPAHRRVGDVVRLSEGEDAYSLSV